MNRPTELLAANSILKRGVRYSIPAPLFFRLLGIKKIKITVTQLCAGTELRVAALMAEKELTEEKLNNTDPSVIMFQHYNDIVKIVALSTLNRFAVSRLALLLRIRLLKTMSVWQLFELYTTVRKYSGTTPFTAITRLALETRMTKPNLGQEKGS